LGRRERSNNEQQQRAPEQEQAYVGFAEDGAMASCSIPIDASSLSLSLSLSLFAAHCSLESLNLHLVLLVPSVLLYSATMLTRSISFSVFCLSITKIYSSTTETVCGGAQFAKVDKRQERERESSRAAEQQSRRRGEMEEVQKHNESLQNWCG
jgi:hypothetical protein